MLARALLLLAVVVWGWTFVATKICLGYMNPVELLGLRLLIACPVLLAIILVRGTSLRRGVYRRSLALGAAIIGLHFYIQITGIQYTSATNTGWIIAVTPLVMALLAALLLGERLHRGLIAGITSDWSRFAELPAEPLAALVFLGVFGMALAHWAWQIGVARPGAAEAGMLLYLEPLATTGLAVPYLGESFGSFATLGGTLVLFGVWISQRRRRPRTAGRLSGGST